MEDGESILALERKSVQPYRTQDEYVWAMREDLAEWFDTLYGLDITAHNFFEQLETGVVLCQHANNVQSFILERLKEGVVQKCRKGATRPLQLPEKGVQYRENVRPGTFQARDNISNFISWCRGLGLPDCLLFETEDLVMLKNERSVVLCLLEVARQGAKYGMEAPMLVQLEAEIEAEIAGETPPPPPRPRITNDHKSLDEMVRELVSRCTCPDEFPMIRVSEGKYKIGDSQTLIFVRILRNHVMVRIGGGWDTLENYLDRHDPCRCESRGHRSKKSTPVKRTTNITSQSPRQGATNTETPGGNTSNHSSQIKSPPSGSPMHHNNSTSRPSPQSNPTTPRSKSTTPMSRRSTTPTPRSVTPNPANSCSGSPVKSIPSSPRSNTPTPRPSTPTKSMSSRSTTPTPKTSRSTTPTPESTPKKKIQRGDNNHNPPKGQLWRVSSSSDLSKAEDENIASTRPGMRRGHTVDTATPVEDLYKGCDNAPPNDMRGRMQNRDASQNSIMPKKEPRSRSAGAKEYQGQSLLKTFPMANKKKEEEVFIISRNTEGKHNFKPINHVNNNDVQGKVDDRRTRLSVTPDRILPDKPKIVNRSASTSSEEHVSPPIISGKNRPRLSSSTSFSSASSYDDLPDPQPNAVLNAEMEQLFEEYRKLELGLQQKINQLHQEDVPENVTEKRKNFKKAKSISKENLLSVNTQRSSNRSSPSPSRERLTSGSSIHTSPTPSLGHLSSDSMNSLSSGPSHSSKVSSNGRPSSSSSRAERAASPSSSRSGRATTPSSTRSDRPSTPSNANSNRASTPTRVSRSGNMTPARARSVTPSRQCESPRPNSARSYTPTPRSETTERAPKTPRSRSQSKENILSNHNSASKDRGRAAHQNGPTQRPASATPVSRTSHMAKRPSSVTPDSKHNRNSRPTTPVSFNRSGTRTQPTTPTNPRKALVKDKTQSRSNGDLLDEKCNGHKQTSREDKGAQTIDLTLTLDVDPFKVTPRKDERVGRKTRIPLPSGFSPGMKMFDSQPLKRYDSGVDINNMSPTDTSIQGEENWQQQQEESLQSYDVNGTALSYAYDDRQEYF